MAVGPLRSTTHLQGRDYARLALSLARMRQKHGFLLTAWVFLPDHWHAIICPPYPLTISRVFQAVKVSSMISINHGRGEVGELWQGRFFDRAESREGVCRDCRVHPYEPRTVGFG